MNKIYELNYLHYGNTRSFGGFCLGTHSWDEGEQKVNFLTMTSFGIKEEGQSFLGMYVTSELAEEALTKQILAYIDKYNQPYLFWRQEPQMIKLPLYELGVWTNGDIYN